MTLHRTTRFHYYTNLNKSQQIITNYKLFYCIMHTILTPPSNPQPTYELLCLKIIRRAYKLLTSCRLYPCNSLHPDLLANTTCATHKRFHHPSEVFKNIPPSGQPPPPSLLLEGMAPPTDGRASSGSYLEADVIIA